MIQITAQPIDPARLSGLISLCGAGSIVSHCAVVKPLVGGDGTTQFIDFSRCGDSEAELSAIAAALSREFAVTDIVMIRRLGRIAVGEIISLVAVSSPNSEDAFEACKQGIARMKKMKTFAKHEVCA